jgi:hypothetical protein
MAKLFFNKNILFAIFLASLLLCGCNSSWTTYGLFTKPELRTFERFALLGLEGEREQIFMAQFIKAYPGKRTTFVERRRIDDIIGEQDFRRGRLNDKTRARMKQVYGVDGLVICEYILEEGSGSSKTKKLRIRVLDSETAVIIGSVVVSRQSSTGLESLADYKTAVAMAVKALKEDMSGMGYY